MQQSMKVLAGNPDHEIPVIVTIPDHSPQPVPVVVLCHGTGSDKDEVGQLFVQLAKQCCEQGIATVRFDFIGTGESTTDYIHYTLSSAVEDVKTVVKLISNDVHLDETRMGILGFSQGGTIALLSASRLQQFTTLVSWSGAPVLKGMLTPQQEAIAKEEGYVDFPFDFRPSLRLSKQWVEEVDQIDVLQEFSTISIPTLAIAGTKDTVIPCVWSQRIQQTSVHDDSECMLVESDHIFQVFDQPEISKKVIEKTCQWLKQHLTR